MRVIEAGNDVLFLGKTGENLATEVRFPIASWVSEYGRGTFQLVVKRNGDTNVYPADFTPYDGGDYLIWNITAADVYYPGYGKCELNYYVEGTLVKSVTWITRVVKSLDDQQHEVPAAYQSWVDRVLELTSGYAESASISADLAEEAYEQAQRIVEGKVYIFFEIQEDGYLYLISSDNMTEDMLSATINEDGELEITIE